MSESLKALSTNNSSDTIITFLLGLLSSLIGIFAGYKISQSQENKKFSQNNHFEYLKHVNLLNIRINDILTKIVNVHKFSQNLLGELYKPLNITPINDYFMVCLKTNTLKSFLLNNSSRYDIDNTNKKVQYRLIIGYIDDIIKPNNFIEIGNAFEYNVCNYYYLIKPKLRKEYNHIIKTIQMYSQNSMQDFDLEEFKRIVVGHIYSINEIIINRKLDRTKELFDNKVD
jgi:hypothetical protein